MTIPERVLASTTDEPGDAAEQLLPWMRGMRGQILTLDKPPSAKVYMVSRVDPASRRLQSVLAIKDSPLNFQVRKALESEKHAISDIVIAAFGGVQGKEIADLVSDLLEDSTAQPLLSLVVTAGGEAVGHILFTNVQVKHTQRVVTSAILAPLSVHPEYQSQGIGGLLINEGLKQLKAAGVDLVFVLGHPGYYPKHGFSAAGILGFDAPYPIPPENSDAWMVQELRPGIIECVSGQVECAEALNDPKHWRE